MKHSTQAVINFILVAAACILFALNLGSRTLSWSRAIVYGLVIVSCLGRSVYHLKKHRAEEG